MVRIALRNFFLGEAGSEPDFENVVRVVISTFAVFVGFTITEYLRKPHVEDFRQWWFWAFVALASLLLRYIIGSSVHLNYVYVKQIDVGIKKRPRSRSTVLLFKDICFLVVFGMVAVQVTKAGNLDDFVRGTLWCVFAGFAWSCIDGLVRGLWSFRDPTEGPGRFLILWITLDVVLFGIVFAVNHYVGDDLSRARAIACIYVLFLFLDFLTIVRATQTSSQPADDAGNAGNIGTVLKVSDVGRGAAG
jgi:hypothetical protein